jgi:SAM-dependent methyltransferase
VIDEIAHCRSCGGGRLILVLDLGSTPLANRLLRVTELGEPEPRYPLRVVFCNDCALAQLTVAVCPETLFGDYPYLSSVSDTVLAHAREIATRTIGERELGRESLVVELASNDGYLLQFYARSGVPVLGIEPAANIAMVANRRGIPTRAAFFGSELAAELAAEGVAADVVHAHNVLAHVPDLNGFVAGIASILKPDGVLVVEVPHVQALVERLEFDTIYHEHLCYFSLTSLVQLFRRHGFPSLDVEAIPLHGGSLRLVAGRQGASTPRVERLLEAERAAGVDRACFYESFSQRVGRLVEELTGELRRRKTAGRRLAAYGAAAKGCMLLNHCGIGQDLLDYAIDRSPFKQGRHLPGTHLPVRPPEALLEDRPDDVLLLAWNLEEEILAQQASYTARGGTFIVPIPTVRVV